LALIQRVTRISLTVAPDTKTGDDPIIARFEMSD
jgi:hypothetical protein